MERPAPAQAIERRRSSRCSTAGAGRGPPKTPLSEKFALVEEDYERDWSDFLAYVVGRPLLLAFWSLIVWGTLYGAALLYAAILRGPAEAWQQAFSSGDQLAGVVNVSLALLAAIVWVTAGVVTWRARTKRGDSNRSIE